MRTSKHIVLLLSLLLFPFLPSYSDIGMQDLGDSLTVWTGFSSVWAPPVKVKNLRVNGNKITVKTNKTLKDVRWTTANIAELKRKVSKWVLGNEKGKVTILTANTDIESLVTNCAKGILPAGKPHDLADRRIALYPSHGLYYNRDLDEWIWQRATLWTTVEDLYSQEYVRLIKQMLENAGATVLMPRAGLEQQQPGVSGMPQWTEGARYWLISQGADSTLWNLYEGDEYKDDMKCRALWVNAQEAPVDLCLAFHTDGTDSGEDSTIVGTLVIYTAKDDDGRTKLRDGRDRETVNRNLADWIQTQVTEDLRVLAPEWTRRQLKEANYCETRVPVVPSIILELLSHKNMADMRYGLDPKFRFAASRAVYKGILRYLSGINAVVQPLPVRQLGINPDGWLKWTPTLDSLEPSATPTYYMVYIQENDEDWNIQQVENTTEMQVELKKGVRYNYYVVAGNEGGLSMPSPVVSAYISEQDNAPLALVVDDFDDVYGVEWFADSTYAGIVPGSYACEDYFSCAYIGDQWNYTRTDPWRDDDNCGWGACYRDHAGKQTIGNTHDWCAQHGRVLRQLRISYVSCTAGMMEACSYQPSAFRLWDIVCGRQRKPLQDASLRQAIGAYLEQGGRVLLSTDHFSAVDPQWAKQYLHATYYASHATHSGRVLSSRYRAYQLMLTPNADQLFTAHPEGLKPTDCEAIKIATYEDMRSPAAVGCPNKTLVFGFPLECTQDFEAICRHAVEWLIKEE